jgi:thiol:disulfide interchange protein
MVSTFFFFYGHISSFRHPPHLQILPSYPTHKAQSQTYKGYYEKLNATWKKCTKSGLFLCYENRKNKAREKAQKHKTQKTTEKSATQHREKRNQGWRRQVEKRSESDDGRKETKKKENENENENEKKRKKKKSTRISRL